MRGLRPGGAGFSQALSKCSGPANSRQPELVSRHGGRRRQYLGVFAEWDVDQYLILSGDSVVPHELRGIFLQRHRATKAAITLGVVPVDGAAASDFGLMRIDSQGRVRSFSEKPTGSAARDAGRYDRARLSRHTPGGALYCVDLGIYVLTNRCCMIS